MINITKLLAIVFLLAVALTGNIYAQPKLVVESGKEDYPLGKYISMLEDKENKLSIDEAASDSMKNKYIYYNKETVNLRFTRSAFWLRLVLVDTLTPNASGVMASQNIKTWILAKNDPLVEEIRVYYKDLIEGGGKYLEKKAGNIIAVSDKVIKTNDFIASFHVQKNVPDTLYLRVKSSSQLIISFDMLTTGEFITHNSKKIFFHGILLGIFLVLIASNSLLYFSIKERTYLAYVLYIFCYTIFIFTYEGYYFEIFGRAFDRDYLILPVAAITGAGIFALLLTREFLSTKMNLPWAYKLLTYLTFVGPINFICMFAFGSQIMAAIWAVCSLGFFIVGFVIAVITLKKGIYLSKYYLLASSGLIMGIFILISTRNNILPLPVNFWTRNSMHFGVLWEALVFAATVGYRFSYLRAEKEKEKSLMRNQIASDLHDEIGSNLSTISLQSQLMMKNQLLDNDVIEQLQNITDTARMTTEKIRDIVWFINPFHDKSEDLVLRMKELASKMLFRLDYSFDSEGNDVYIFDLLPDLNVRRHIFLIFKETLNNVIKHSEATEVNILLTAKEKKFIMIVADNGKGFNEEKIVRGAGLSNIRNRAALIGAQILIENNGGNGTKIILEVPLKD